MRKRSHLIGAAALMLALLAGAPAAQARTAAAPVAYTCPAPSLSSVFAPWYDWSLYMRAPAGGFDTGVGAWSVAGPVTAVSDDNPLLGGVSGRSLQLAPGASVTS